MLVLEFVNVTMFRPSLSCVVCVQLLCSVYVERQSGNCCTIFTIVYVACYRNKVLNHVERGIIVLVSACQAGYDMSISHALDQTEVIVSKR